MAGVGLSTSCSIATMVGVEMGFYTFGFQVGNGLHHHLGLWDPKMMVMS
jgi:hypothetical protein